MKWRCPILRHDQFDELCAIASVGELSAEEWQILNAHLSECPSCRSLLTDLGEIHAQWLPEHPGYEFVRNDAADSRLRDAILLRATKEGARFSKEASGTVGASRRSVSAVRQKLWIAAAAAVLILCFAGPRFAGYGFRTESQARSIPSVIVTPPSRIAPTPLNQGPGAREAELKLRQQIEDAAAAHTLLQLELEKQKSELAAMRQKNWTAEQTMGELRHQLDNSRAAQMQYLADVADLRAKQATTDAVAIAEQQEVQALRQQLSDQTASLERERQLLAAGREIRDLIAARSLHIIDVYDTNSKGGTNRAFGRVFYTEGKSLVFYAYDLKADSSNPSKYSFYLWGGQDGTPQDARKLGALHKDASAQAQWMLTVTDPKVLAEIDSVFVTLEPAGKRMHRPSGKRILNAFLKTPVNHP